MKNLGKLAIFYELKRYIFFILIKFRGIYVLQHGLQVAINDFLNFDSLSQTQCGNIPY